MKMKNICTLLLQFSLSIIVVSIGWSQATPTPAPTATPISFDSGCMNTQISDQNLITNGDFSEGAPSVGMPPDTGWLLGEQTPVLRSETLSSTQGSVDNYFLEFSQPGTSIITVPQNYAATNRFTLTFCTVIPAGGQIRILVGGTLVAGVPAVPGAEFTGLFKYELLLNLSNGIQSEKQIEIYYDGAAGSGPAYVDNVQLLPSLATGEDDVTPTPTIEEPTPTPEPQGPSPTPTPTIQPGIPSPTPTPGITADSVQLTANPPMLVVSPDDFASTNVGIRKQISLDLSIVGSNGEKMNILNVDDKATIRFVVDERGDAAGVGAIESFESTSSNWQSLNSRRIELSQFMNDYHGRAYFFPMKPYTGTVRVIVEIEYKGWANGSESNRKIRGVVPIVLQVDKSASLTDATGTYNATQNYNLGKKPGDRGFRPDARTNLYFRERIK